MNNEAVLLKLVNRYKEQLNDTEIKLANALVMIDQLQAQIDSEPMLALDGKDDVK